MTKRMTNFPLRAERVGMMKIDDLLERLKNVETDENNEKHEIVEYIVQKLSNDDIRSNHSMITKDKTIYGPDSYEKLLESNEISADEAYVYVDNNGFLRYDTVKYLYPFLRFGSQISLVKAYLSKLGFRSLDAVPAPRLRYIAIVFRFLTVGRMVVEVTDIATATFNTNLPMLVRGILRTKYLHNFINLGAQRGRKTSPLLGAGMDSPLCSYILIPFCQNFP